ncbi:DUF418 domain-containing protein [Chitinophagaceae bacterium LB-8]|uniref:DUF418 domain-containing protein n=1 Tax=Paraflavisolibacter caeni TaxID=2982496 RepID=A0A9X2XXU7_9BACT|nr:DUF418 domain-containing protein [Paraflavisolibacter caeni]MCU7550692.1 DUF418 domain-containing protein [Paraflavisolibacter caeni]
MTLTAAAPYSKPHQTSIVKIPRIEVVDALRGFAIFAIMLLHNLEHFDFYYFPQHLPAWVKAIDKGIWDSIFFLFAGKAYAIFALLFGFTFFIQMENQAKKGVDFRLRFVWRLFLLMIFGCINALFYEGDILSFYALLGVILVPVGKWNNKALLITAIILLLQPVEWINVINILNTPGYVIPKNLSDQYFSQVGQFMAGSSFWKLIKGNFLVGRPAVFFWSWENGRFFQTPALFLLGMLLGRQRRFLASEQNAQFWKKILMIAAVSFIPLFYLKGSMHQFVATEALAKKLSMIITTWSNFAFMMVLVSSFVYLYTKNAAKRVLNTFAPLGRMSLTNYIVQSILGTLVYYGYGLGLYQYTGATYCLLIGILLFTLQLFFCRWWLSRHKQGPLENLWHRATWL